MQGTSHCIWPQRKVDALRPSSFCMQELLPRCLGEVANGSLSDAVLEVSVDAAKGECLLLLFGVLLEGVVGKSAVVTMIMFDSDALLAELYQYVSTDLQACIVEQRRRNNDLLDAIEGVSA